MHRAWAIAGLAALTLAGCDLYCEPSPPEGPWNGLRNPYTGQCETWGSGGGSTCRAWGGAVPDQDPVDWAMCYGECSGLGETACLATSGCRAAYLSDCPDAALCDGPLYQFAECWAVAPSGPVQGGSCHGLDAYECSRHDDCVARHHRASCGPDGPCALDVAGAPQPPSIVGDFDHCAPEPQAPSGCFTNDDCPGGHVCTALTECAAPADCDPGSADCMIACYGVCVPDDSAGPGTCHGDVLCDSLPPECPPDAVPGILDGCWSGHCIPLSECAAGPCASLGSEAECISRVDCAPVYRGEGCECDADGHCTCQDWIFQECVGP